MSSIPFYRGVFLWVGIAPFEGLFGCKGEGREGKGRADQLLSPVDNQKPPSTSHSPSPSPSSSRSIPSFTGPPYRTRSRRYKKSAPGTWARAQTPQRESSAPPFPHHHPTLTSHTFHSPTTPPLLSPPSPPSTPLPLPLPYPTPASKPRWGGVGSVFLFWKTDIGNQRYHCTHYNHALLFLHLHPHSRVPPAELVYLLSIFLVYPGLARVEWFVRHCAAWVYLPPAIVGVSYE